LRKRRNYTVDGAYVWSLTQALEHVRSDWPGGDGDVRWDAVAELCVETVAQSAGENADAADAKNADGDAEHDQKGAQLSGGQVAQYLAKHRRS
jgi:hypothetical protein